MGVRGCIVARCKCWQGQSKRLPARALRGHKAGRLRDIDCFFNDVVAESSDFDTSYRRLARIEPWARGHCQGASKLQRVGEIMVVFTDQYPERVLM